MKKGKLILIPTTIGDLSTVPNVIPSGVIEQIRKLDEFIVEKERTARRYLANLKIYTPISNVILHEIDKFSDHSFNDSFFESLNKGKDIGLLSEAGCPGIADPGQEIVNRAHEKGFQVIPLTGPSSIFLALMASGFNGQNFAFHGYIPIKNPERLRKLKEFEKNVYSHNQTQIFMETPYRNQQLFIDIVNACSSKLKLCIAVNLTMENEFIRSMSVEDWKSETPSLHKQPAIFLIGS